MITLNRSDCEGIWNLVNSIALWSQVYAKAYVTGDIVLQEKARHTVLVYRSDLETIIGNFGE